MTTGADRFRRFNLISQQSANAANASPRGLWMPWSPRRCRSLTRPCKQAAQKGVDILHCCCLGVRPTVEMIWQSETSAVSPHSLHNFFCMEFPFPFIKQAKYFNDLVNRAPIQYRRTSNNHGGGASHRPTFRLMHRGQIRPLLNSRTSVWYSASSR